MKIESLKKYVESSIATIYILLQAGMKEYEKLWNEREFWEVKEVLKARKKF